MKTRRKIVHVITGLNTGGAEMMLFKLLAGMDLSRFENIIVSMVKPGAVGQKIRDLGVTVYSLDMVPGRPSPVAAGRLVGMLRRERPDIVQTWLYHADLLGLLTSVAARRPVVVWNLRASNIEMAHYRRLSGWTRRACALLSGLPRAVIVNSEAGRDFHRRLGYRPREWVLIRNGIETERFIPDPEARSSVRRELCLSDEALLIGLIARFDPMKDHRNFFRAASILHRQLSNVHFLLAGRGVTRENPEIRQLIDDASLLGNLHLLGERHDIPRLTAALDVATSSSIGEGFSNTIAEAMSCGVPCVATDVGDSAAIVGSTGIVVPPAKPEALAAAWEKLLGYGDEELREMGKAARNRIQESFSLADVTKMYEELYYSLGKA